MSGAELFEDRVSGASRGLDHRAEAADCEFDERAAMV